MWGINGGEKRTVIAVCVSFFGLELCENFVGSESG